MRHVTTWAVIVAFGVAASPLKAVDPDAAIAATVVFGGQLLCLSDRGEIRAWDLKTTEFAKDSVAKYTLKGLTGLASDGDTLWAASGSTLYRWNAKYKEWHKEAVFESGDESLTAIVPVG